MKTAASVPNPCVLVGAMSGTSADGITVAVVRIGTGFSAAPTVELLAHQTSPYAFEQRDRLLRAIESATPAELCRLDFELGRWVGAAVRDAVAKAGVDLADVRAIASHGHTLWHEPPRGTLQLGQPAVIAECTGVDVVSDFRARDVAAGGQGAPLVAVADRALFAAPGRWRALQNIGGIANVSIVPPLGASGPTIAFDTGPGVAVIDGVVRSLVPRLPYDVDGEMARRGRALSTVVDALLSHEYFARTPPKSTGRELFTADYVAKLIADCRAAAPSCSDADIVATAVALTARSIAIGYARFVSAPIGDVVVSGGGSRNPALIGALTAALAPLSVRRFDELFFDGDAKEAVAFAYLGWLHLTGQPGNVPDATGASGPRVLGCLTPA